MRDGWINQLICKVEILIAILQAFETLVQVLDFDDEVGDGVEEQVERSASCSIADVLLGVIEVVDND